jgi:hypothetical protein
LIVAGTTEETMRSLYARPHRSSIYDPVTIHDIPQEVLGESLIYLLPSVTDLVSASSACRAWRPVAQKLIHSILIIDPVKDERVENVVCGYQLNSLVFGSWSFQISSLSLELSYFQKEYIPLIAQIVGPTLFSLEILCCGLDGFHDPDVDFIICLEILEIFFSRCRSIRNLRLDHFGVGDDPDEISPVIKEGFSRLKQLDLLWCEGDLRLFIESHPIPNLKSFRYQIADEDVYNEEIVDAVAVNYGPDLVNLNLDCCTVFSANLANIAERCQLIENLTLSDTEVGKEFSLSDMTLIASLPRLKSLELVPGCRVAVGAVSALKRVRCLKHLKIGWIEGMSDVLRVIGRTLIHLDVYWLSYDEIDGIIEYCPNLQYLDLNIIGLKRDAATDADLVKKAKRELKNLAKLRVNYVSVRLGTDWKGYTG